MASSVARRTSGPAHYQDTVPIEPERSPEEGYHFTEDIADRAADWIRQQRALMPDKPFFLYFAPGATHAPHHVPAEWSDRYRGRFDPGWDALREDTIVRQRAMGIVPESAQLTDRPAEIPAWDDMPSDLRPVLARQMEVYAGFLEHADHHVGRLIDTLEDLQILEDTLVLYLIGDNGASAEGTIHGTFNELVMFSGPGLRNARNDGVPYRRFRWSGCVQPLRGGLGPCDGHPLSVDQAGRVALGRYAKRRDRALAARNSRSRRAAHQFHHVIDVAPTVLEAAGIPSRRSSMASSSSR